MRRYSILIVIVVVLLLVTNFADPRPALGQQTPAAACNTILPQVTEKLGSCKGVDKDQLCYGYPAINVEYRDAANKPTFGQPGDMIALNTIKSVSTAKLDLKNNQWGLAVLKAQASVPGVSTGQAVTFVLYGEAKFENATVPTDTTSTAPTCAAKVSRFTYLRAKPGPQEGQVAGLQAQSDITLLGRVPGGDWLRAQAGDKTGWVFADVIRPGCDLNSLPVLSPDGGTAAAAEPLPVMPDVRAFYFTSGVSAQAECKDVPTGGMVISSPKGQKVSFNVNGADVTIGSTVLLRTLQNTVMTFAVIEGNADITIDNVTKKLDAGDELFLPIRPQTLPRPQTSRPLYDASRLNINTLGLSELCKLSGAATGLEIPCEPVQSCTMNLVRFTADRPATQLRYNLSGVPFCQNVRLDWEVRDVESVKLNNTNVSRIGSLVVCPFQTTTYNLQMTCKGQTRTASTTVTVRR